MHGNRAGCAWGKGWVVGVGLVVHGVRLVCETMSSMHGH